MPKVQSNIYGIHLVCNVLDQFLQHYSAEFLFWSVVVYYCIYGSHTEMELIFILHAVAMGPNYLIPGCIAHFKKLTAAQLVNIFPTYYGTLKFITV